jgi:hypothetical protein
MTLTGSINGIKSHAFSEEDAEVKATTINCNRRKVANQKVATSED